MSEIPAQSQPTSNHKSINWRNIIIGTVIGAILVGLGVFVFLILQPKPETTSTVTTKKATPSATTATPSAKKDETADWKTYSSKNYSINYPKDWLSRGCEGNVSFAPNNNLLGICQSGDVGLVYIVQVDTDYNAYINRRNPSAYDNYLQEETKVSGKEAIKTSGTFNGSVEGTPKGAQQIAYIVNFNGKVLVINYVRQSGWDDYSKIFESMVSTFKFLD